MDNTKKVTVSAKCLLNYDGVSYGAGMQFVATQHDADALIKSGQAEKAPPSTKPVPKPAAE